jgi:hypothetical protein
MDVNLFERASRKKYRFESARGDLTVEQLWDLPLSSRNGVDLDTIARGVNAELKSITEESFVETKPNPRKLELVTCLEILKHIIKVKQDEAAAAKNRVEKAAKRARIIEALAAQEDKALTQMSKEDLLKELAGLDEDVAEAA